MTLARGRTNVHIEGAYPVLQCRWTMTLFIAIAPSGRPVWDGANRHGLRVMRDWVSHLLSGVTYILPPLSQSHV